MDVLLERGTVMMCCNVYVVVCSERVLVCVCVCVNTDVNSSQRVGSK
jgi:hypothetical protein